MTRITARPLPFGAAAALAPLVLAAAPALAAECGEIVTGSARLHRDLVCTTDPALTVDGGRLGGSGGHVVRGVTASASNQGVFVESDGNRLLDSHVLRGRDDAAVQVDGSNNLLRANDLVGSLDQGFEINGNDNRIVGNRIGGVVEGIQLMGERNHVLRNQIIGATERGIEVRQGAHVIKRNLIADGALDGVALLGDGHGNEISRNAIYGHGDQGLFVGTFDNTLEGNRVLLNAIDVTDATPDCDANLWRNNVFETSVSDDCVD